MRKQKVLNYHEAFPVHDLKPFPKNPRKHTQQQIDLLVKNIERFGFLDPILVQKSTNYIICGHARLKALVKMGEETADVFVWDVNNEDAMAHMIASNYISGMSSWDIPFVKDCLAELDGRSYPVDHTGFSDVSVDCLFDHESKDKPKDDFKDVALGMGKTKKKEPEDPMDGDYVKYVLLCKEDQREIIMTELERYRVDNDFLDHANALIHLLESTKVENV